MEKEKKVVWNDEKINNDFKYVINENINNDYSVFQTHPNHGFLNVNGKSYKFYVNNQVAPGIGSSQPRKYEFEDGNIFDSLDDAYITYMKT